MHPIPLSRPKSRWPGPRPPCADPDGLSPSLAPQMACGSQPGPDRSAPPRIGLGNPPPGTASPRSRKLRRRPKPHQTGTRSPHHTAVHRRITPLPLARPEGRSPKAAADPTHWHTTPRLLLTCIVQFRRSSRLRHVCRDVLHRYTHRVRCFEATFRVDERYCKIVRFG